MNWYVGVKEKVKAIHEMLNSIQYMLNELQI